MSKNLTYEDYKSAAQELGVEIEVIKAVAEVESRGDGFFNDGRPKILFEAHIFSSRTKRKYDITHPNISSRKWNRSLYKGGEKEYDRLNQAIALDKIAALESTSWGKFQIMGFNAKAIGWSNVISFVDDMYISEGHHLTAFVKFIQTNNLAKYLQRKNWSAFAKSYNGPAYKQNNYDSKMKNLYEKYVSERSK